MHAVEVLPHPIQEKPAGLAHSAAQQDAPRVQCVLDVDTGDGQVEAGFVPEAQSHLIPSLGGGRDVRPGQLPAGLDYLGQ